MRAHVLVRGCGCMFALVGCNPLAFDTYEDDAPVVALDPPGDYPQRPFGIVVTGYRAELEDKSVSRVAASGGPNTPFVVYAAWENDRLSLGRSLFAGCDSQKQCGA